MLLTFSTPGLIRHLWQLKTVVFLHWCLIHSLLLEKKKKYKIIQPFPLFLFLPVLAAVFKPFILKLPDNSSATVPIIY